MTESLLARLDRLRLTVFGLLAITSGLLLLGLTNAGWCMPAVHAALTFATALATWWLARDDLGFDRTGDMVRLVLTGVSLGLGLTWAAAVIAALLDVGAAAQWTHGEFNQVLRHFLEDTAWHWTPLGLVSAFLGTGLAVVVDELSGTSARREQGK